MPSKESQPSEEVSSQSKDLPKKAIPAFLPPPTPELSKSSSKSSKIQQEKTIPSKLPPPSQSTPTKPSPHELSIPTKPPPPPPPFPPTKLPVSKTNPNHISQPSTTISKTTSIPSSKPPPPPPFSIPASTKATSQSPPKPLPLQSSQIDSINNKDITPMDKPMEKQVDKPKAPLYGIIVEITIRNLLREIETFNKAKLNHIQQKTSDETQEQYYNLDLL